VPWIDGQRRHDRIKDAVKIVFQEALLFASPFLGSYEMNALGAKFREDGREKTLVLFFGQLVSPFRDSR